MGFYGRINNSNKSQFVFTKTYSNRVAMDADATGSDVKVGQYVLVDYDDAELKRIYLKSTADNDLDIAWKNVKENIQSYKTSILAGSTDVGYTNAITNIKTLLALLYNLSSTTTLITDDFIVNNINNIEKVVGSNRIQAINQVDNMAQSLYILELTNINDDNKQAATEKIIEINGNNYSVDDIISEDLVTPIVKVLAEDGELTQEQIVERLCILSIKVTFQPDDLKADLSTGLVSGINEGKTIMGNSYGDSELKILEGENGNNGIAYSDAAYTVPILESDLWLSTDTEHNPICVYTADNNEEKIVITSIKYYTIEYNETIVTGTKYDIIANSSTNKYTFNYNIDINVYGEGRGYDSTVWQKIAQDGTLKYAMIAELNSVVPTFDITGDAPNFKPIAPHFDAASTNVYYKMHQQVPWGFKIKPTDISHIGEDEIKIKNEGYVYDKTSRQYIPYTSDTTYQGAIYYNEAGFNEEVRTNSKNENNITLTPTGYSGESYSHKKPDGTEYPDIMEMAISLPSIGNSVSKMWDIVYGNEEQTGGENRKTDIKWDDNDPNDSADRLRLVHFNAGESSYSYNENNQVNTLAGAINSAHDLLGMIISPYDKDEKIIDPNNGGPKDPTSSVKKEHNDSIVNNSDYEHIYYYDGNYYRLGINYDYTNYTGSVNPTKGDDGYYEMTFVNNSSTPVYTYDNNSYYQLINTDTDKYIPYYYVTEEQKTFQGQYEPNKYYYKDGEDYKLETSITLPDITTTPLYIIEANSNQTPLCAAYTELVPGGGTTKIKQYAYYYKEKEEDKIFKPITSLGYYEGSGETRTYHQVHPNANYIYYRCNLVATGQTQVIVDSDGNISVVDTYTVEYPKVSNPINITNIPVYNMDVNKNYIKVTEDELPNSSSDPITLEAFNKLFKNYYTITETAFDKIYKTSEYWLKQATEDGKGYDYILSVNDYDEEKTYYEVTDKLVNFYIKNYYYTKNGDNYEISVEAYDNSKTYYKKITYYVTADSNNIYQNSDLPLEWLGQGDNVPAGITLAVREPFYVWIPLEGFARNLNTMHGELLTMREKLDGYNDDNRRDDNITGVLNKVKDLINKIEVLNAGTFMTVDDCGRIVSTPYTSSQEYQYKNIGTAGDWSVAEDDEDQYVQVDIDPTYTNPKITFAHKSHIESDTTTISDKNTAKTDYTGYDALGLNNSHGDTLDLYTPIVDNMGHIVGNNKETVTLPYGYKTITSTGLVLEDLDVKPQDLYTTITYDEEGGKNTETKIDPTALDNKTIADNTQDLTALDPVNKWIQVKIENDKISLAHEIHAIDETEATASDLNTGTEKNKLNIPDMKYDGAGHVTLYNKHEYTLPYGFKTIKDSETSQGSAVAESTQDEFTFKGDTWVKPVVTNTDKNALITFSHLDANTTTHTKVNDVTPAFGDTVSITDLDFDSKGHKANSGSHTILIPGLVYNDDTDGNTVTNITYQYDADNHKGIFTEERNDLATIKLGTYTTPTTGGSTLDGNSTLATAISTLDTRIYNEEEDRKTKQGTLTSLTTDSKTNLVSAINELDSHINGITVKAKDAAEDGFLKTYYVEVEGKQVGVSINIPKDFLVKSGTLGTVTEADKPYTGAKVGDKYLDFILNTKGDSEKVTDDHLYVPVNDLFDSYTSGSAATDAVVITVDNSTNKISASITDATIARSKIDANFEADITAVENAIIRLDNTDTVENSIAYKIKNAIEGLDATASQSTGDDGLALSVTETDGKITAISGSITNNVLTTSKFTYIDAVDHTEEIASLQSTIDTESQLASSKRTQIAANNDTITSDKAEQETLDPTSQEYKNLQNEIDKLTTENITLDGEASALESDVATKTAKIAELRAEEHEATEYTISELTKYIKTLEDRIAALEAK